ncbi:hypothetical protein TNCV_2541761 [Trichonephila clavipes]|nr:hypothetical protein TNCV_2541761 [Trichonephila clavipes]
MAVRKPAAGFHLQTGLRVKFERKKGETVCLEHSRRYISEGRGKEKDKSRIKQTEVLPPILCTTTHPRGVPLIAATENGNYTTDYFGGWCGCIALPDLTLYPVTILPDKSTPGSTTPVTVSSLSGVICLFGEEMTGRGGRVVYVSDRGWLCHELEPSTTKTHRVGQRCTLNLSRAETSSRWCGVVVRRGGASSGAVHVT